MGIILLSMSKSLLIQGMSRHSIKTMSLSFQGRCQRRFRQMSRKQNTMLTSSIKAIMHSSRFSISPSLKMAATLLAVLSLKVPVPWLTCIVCGSSPCSAAGSCSCPCDGKETGEGSTEWAWESHENGADSPNHSSSPSFKPEVEAGKLIIGSMP